MNKRFIFELIVGVTGFAAVILFGRAGISAFALFALLPLFRKKNPDEREIQLFYRTGNLTAALTLLAAVIFYLLSGKTVNGFSIGDNWLALVIFSFLLAHGLSGLIMFNKG